MIGRVQAWTEAKYSTLTKRATQMPFFMEKAIDIKCLHIEDSEVMSEDFIRWITQWRLTDTDTHRRRQGTWISEMDED